MKKFFMSVIIILFLLTANIWGQESFFSDESFSDSEGSGGGFGGDFSPDMGFSLSGSSPLSINGEVTAQARCFPDYDDLGNSEMETFPEARLKLQHHGERADMTANLFFSKDVIYEDFADVINEAYMRLYFNSFNLEAGYMKTVWGKGDELKAVDVLNPIDYSDFYNKDLLERKKSSLMAKLNVNIGLAGLLEAVYLPLYDPSEFGYNKWDPYEIKKLRNFADKTKSEIKTEKTNDISHSQFGLRYTDSIGGFDFGLLYYFGFMPLPTGKISMEGTELKAKISFDRTNMFGAEFATVLAGFNMRGEIGYFLTEDHDGTDNSVQNSKLCWAAGFDRDLPFWGANILAEAQGTYTLQNNEIENKLDVDYSKNYSRHIIAGRITGSFRHEKIKPEIAVSCHLEDMDFMFRPKIDIAATDEISFNIMYSLYSGDEDTIFGVYDDNDFFQIRMTYFF